MNHDDQLRQQMLEMIHGLLSDEESQALRDRISSDPEVARAYSEVSIEADLIARAARLEGPKVSLPENRGKRAAAPGAAAAWMPWAVYLALSLLVAVTLGGYLWDRVQQRDVAAEHLRLVVAAPAVITPGVESRVTVRTETIAGRPLPASVELSLTAVGDKANGGQPRQLLSAAERVRRSEADGVPLEFVIPANLGVTGPVQLEVLAHGGGSEPKFSRTITVEPQRFVTQLGLDKPWYQPGDTVFFRSLTLEGFSLSAQQEMPLEFEILDPAGSPVAGSKQQGVTERGVGNGSFALNAGLAGGQYTLVVRSLETPPAFAEQKKEFLVQQYRVPRLKKDLELTRDSYAPGDEVVADFSAVKAEGGPAAGAKLQVIATVDGQEVYKKDETASADGTFQVRFKLPTAIENGNGQLAVVVDDGGTRETAAKTIPINLGKLTVDFYPEGGDLVEGLPNRVYFTALDPAGEPVHIEGQVVDGAGRAVADVATVKDGRGSFSIVPTSGQSFQLKLSKPQNVKSTLMLPATNVARSVVLSTGSGVFAAGEPLTLAITSKRARLPLVVTATCRGTAVGQATHMTGEAGAMGSVALPLASAADGVIRVTVYDYSGAKPEPVAERLVFRRGTRKLNVTLAESDAKFSPGQKAELKLKVTDERGQPTAATLGVAVVDDAMLALAKEQTKHQPATMPTHFRLASEIEKPEQLEDVNFYLTEDPKAAQALDLLLGTQGWRRFASVRLDELVRNNAAPQDRAALEGLLIAAGKTSAPVVHDNLNEIRGPYERQLLDYEAAHEKRRALIGRLAFFGGVALLLGIAVLGMVRLLSTSRVWVPAMAGATACLIVGGLWMNAASRGPGSTAALAMFRADDEQLKYYAGDKTVPNQQGGVSTAGDRSYGKRGNDVGSTTGGVPNYDDSKPDKAGKKREVPKPTDRPGLDLDSSLTSPATMPTSKETPAPVTRPDPDKTFGNLPERERRLRGADSPVAQTRPSPSGQQQSGQEGNQSGRQQGKEDADGRQGQERGLYAIGGRGQGLLLQWQAARLQQQVRAADEDGDNRGDGEKLRKLQLQLAQLTFPVRQYAHRHLPAESGVRTDFTETLYWNPLVISNAQGEATIRFDLSDAVTTFRVAADAQADTVTSDGSSALGRIGAGGGSIVSRIPFSLEPKLPLEVNAGDLIELPVAVVNDTNKDMAVTLKFETDKLLKMLTTNVITGSGGGYTGSTVVNAGVLHIGDPKIDVKASSRQRQFFVLAVTGENGNAKLKISGTANDLSDTVERTIAVVPPGFPVLQSQSGQIDGEQKLTITLPKDWVPGSLAVSVKCFPTPLADLQAGMESILQEPYGCFEQTSTSNYPNVLALRYLQEHRVADPAITRRARDLLAKGYARLTGFACRQGGFEWFGKDPGHEALTAYGLMQFRDMAAVYDVDPAMMDRTANWLLSRRDGRGGFQRSSDSHSFGSAPPEVTNAYIVWALTESANKQPGSGQKQIDKEVELVVDTGRKSDDPYVIALAAASAVNYGQNEAGRELLRKLAGKQQADGQLTGTQGSITRSGGVSLDVETTALAALAWLKLPEFTPQANKAMEWIVKSRQGTGGFGSTQGTILALKALVAHAKASRATQGGELIVKRGDAEIGRVKFAAATKDKIELAGLGEKLQAGDNNLALSLSGDNKMPYAVSVEYRTRTPVSQDACPVRLTTKLDAAKVTAGATVGLAARLTNTTDKGQPMTIAILGIPGGTRPRADQLEELKKNGTVDYFELRPREIVCYWRGLAPKQTVDLRLDLVAEIPGRYTAPASRAYLYYTAEQKQWAGPVAVEITRE